MELGKRPWIVLNAAMTADGKIDTFARDGAKISSDDDWARVDQLRAEVDAVMVGGRTLLSEDPRLTVRSEELRQARLQAGRPANPAKVGVVSYADLPADSRFLTDGGAQMFLFTTDRTNPNQVEALRALGAEVVVTPDQVDLTASMAYLKNAGIERLLLEGGGILNAAMLAEDLIDEIRVYIAPLIFGGTGAPTLFDGPGLTRPMAVELGLQNVELMPDGGILATYLVRPKI